MRPHRCASMLFLALGLVLVVGCDDDSVHGGPGVLSVSIVDATRQSTADIEVRIEPLGLRAMTDAQGVASFSLPPGGYFVDARVCCRGPSYIDYHVPAIVTAWETTTVVLHSCLGCQ